MKRYSLEITVFTTGGLLMILELCGSRILAPYVGSSIDVWTSLIGVILGSLSLGYYLGGRIADKGGGRRELSLVIFASAVLIALIVVLKEPLLVFTYSIHGTLGLKAVISAIFLFAIPSILLGTISPLAAKLKIQTLKTAGGAVGSLYAWSTIGSIVGTFFAGFVLLTYFSITQILIGISLVLLLLSLCISARNIVKKSLSFLLLLVVSLVITHSAGSSVKTYESKYSHIEISTINNMKVLKINNAWHSAMFTDRQGLAFEYTKFYDLAKKINPKTKHILMIGGGAFTVATEYLRLYPDVTMDVVEIDPLLQTLAQKEFGLKESNRLRIFNEDGRTFLNREEGLGNKKYDAIFMDAFSGYSIPFQLASVEAIRKLDSLLNENGMVITNAVSGITGEHADFLNAEYATYNSIFPQVEVVRVHPDYATDFPQNIMILAFKENTSLSSSNAPQLANIWTQPVEDHPLLTDDFAPVEQYVREYEF